VGPELCRRGAAAVGARASSVDEVIARSTCLPRTARPAGVRDVAGESAEAEADESWELVPDERADSGSSANAVGIAAMAEPTPNATAKAPTRPT
jgi:hypothetical protein